MRTEYLRPTTSGATGGAIYVSPTGKRRIDARMTPLRRLNHDGRGAGSERSGGRGHGRGSGRPGGLDDRHQLAVEGGVGRGLVRVVVRRVAGVETDQGSRTGDGDRNGVVGLG